MKGLRSPMLTFFSPNLSAIFLEINASFPIVVKKTEKIEQITA